MHNHVGWRTSFDIFISFGKTMICNKCYPIYLLYFKNAHTCLASQQQQQQKPSNLWLQCWSTLKVMPEEKHQLSILIYIWFVCTSYWIKGRRGRECMVHVVGFTTTCAISAYHHYKVVCSNPVHGELYSIQHYVIKFVSTLRQVSGFLRIHWFPLPIKLTATI